MTESNTAAVAVAVNLASAVASRADMTAAMAIVTEAVERRNPHPILSNVRITAGDNGAAFVTGTDLDMELTVRIPAAIDSEFGVTVPAHLLRDLLKKAAKSDHVAFTADDGFAVADFEKVKYRLQSLPVADFPDMLGPSHNKARRFTMTGADFVRGLENTMGAVSYEETRYYLNGIFAHVTRNHQSGADEFRMVATDGHRLYVQSFPVPDGAATMPGVIIPRKAVAMAHKLMKGKKCPDSVSLEVTDTKIRLTWECDGYPVTLTSKLIDGTFPDYQRVIPAYNDKKAVIESDAALEAIASVSLISAERGRAVKLAFSDRRCEFSVNNPDKGSAQSEVPCCYAGDEIEVGINAVYLASIIGVAGSESVTIELADNGTPIRFSTGHDDGWTGVVMPMRV